VEITAKTFTTKDTKNTKNGKREEITKRRRTGERKGDDLGKAFS
jgi:hypothetical protein